MKRLMIVAACATLGACASIETTVPDAESITRISQGSASALIVNIAGDLQCDYAFFGVNRRGEETNTVVTTIRDAGYDSSTPAMILVEPGRYSLNRGSCTRGGYYPIDFPNLNRWFGTVEVGENEVVYMGTLTANMVDFSTRSSFENGFARFWLATPADTQSSYVVYTMEDNPEVRERISATWPEIAPRMTFRAPPQRISNEMFLGYLEEAFAADAAGVRPTRAEAMVRFQAIMEREFGPEDGAAASSGETGAATAPAITKD